MKTSIKNRKKQLLALCLSMMMFSSFTALAACNDDTSSSSSSSSSSSTSTEKDESLVTNGGFETFDTNDGKNVIGTSTTGWSRSVGASSTGSANSSTAVSGIIDTDADNWAQLTTSNVDVSKLTEDQARKQWDTLTVKDKLDYYAAWKEANSGKTISKELDFYESFNIDNEDLPTCENPGTHDGDTDKTNVLMIHNQYPEVDSTSYSIMGTAQKYTSSSTVTVKAGTSVAFSVWVKTSDLKSSSTSGEAQDVVNKGAYISVSHAVGGKTMEAFQVKNINTSDVTENNGWMQYSFYLKGTAYVDTTFNIVLGLGQGGKTDKLEYVNGYAFFDDIECEVISNDAFDAKKAEGLYSVDFNSSKDAMKVDYTSSETAFAIDYYSSFEAIDMLSVSEESESKLTIAPTTETSNKKVYTAAYGVDGAEVYNGLGINTTNDVTKVFENAAALSASDNKYVQKAYEKYFKDVEFLNGEKLLMLLSAEGAAYTATSSQQFTIKANEYLAISCYVKTSKMNGFTGAGVTLVDGKNKTSISAIDTTTIAAVEIGENEDVFQGWQQCLFFIENTTDADRVVSLEFNYGSTTVVGTTRDKYYAGFAAFANFESYKMSKTEYECTTEGSYSKIVTLSEKTETTGDSGFDSIAGVQTDKIETGYANPKNYTGVYNNSAYISNEYTNTERNTNATAGLLNKEYEAAYKENGILEKLGGETWADVFGTATQPLVIYNEKDAENSYGYFGKITTLSANSYKTISMRVKVSAGATANIYLVDMTEDSHDKMLSIGSNVVYWYDDDGNVCAKDPADEHFNAKKDVAFKLQANGLYKVNPNWSGAKDVDANAYFANLANYETDSETGNKLVAEGGVTYNYNDLWNGVGKDGIAFYAKDGKYYADSAYKTEVFDFNTTSLAPRYEAQEGKDLCFEITDTNGEWATVTFQLHTGEQTKTYRLEVWSGSRDGENVKAGSYVFFDSYSPTTLDATSFANLVEERKDGLDEANYFESVFSFFDSAKYLRYDETVDENEVGYAYESYLPSSQASSVAYLRYESENVYEVYADYALSDVTVTPDADDDTTNDTEDDHDHDHESEMNPWLLASSIAVAAALFVAIVAVVVRKVLEYLRKKNGYQPLFKARKKDEKKSK